MDPNAKIYVAGHRGLVGDAIVEALKFNSYTNICVRNSSELDLRNQAKVESFFEEEKPEYVFLCAAYVGGIKANNDSPAEFYFNNIQISNNVIHSAYKANCKRLLFLGSSCIYPKFADQPLKEEYLLTGSLEPTNEAYAIAKIAGLKMCAYYRKQYGIDFFSAMPTNLYGYNDNFDLNTSHVLPALLRKFHKAKINKQKSVELWGTGKPLREFLFVDDLAMACLHLMTLESINFDWINVGSGQELSIKELATLIAEIVGFKGNIEFNPQYPDGTPRKLLDSSKIIKLGWQARVSLEEGIKAVYKEHADYFNQLDREEPS